VRNVQLSLFSLLPALAPVIFSHASNSGLGAGGWLSTLFRNFGAWAWATVLVQVFGGLVTAMVIKYSDNILKGFATSLSIVISFLASVALFNFQITFTFVLGSAIVLIATWLYNQPPKRAAMFSPEMLWGLTRCEKHREDMPRSGTPLSPILGWKVAPTSSRSSMSSGTTTPPLYDQAGNEKNLYTR